MAKSYDLIIVGAGPAGLTAALYASRANLSVLVIEKSLYGGKIMKTAEVDNYPGQPLISGVELGTQFYNQIANSPYVDYMNTEVSKVTEDKKVILVDGTEIQAPYIVIGTGTQERQLGIPYEEEFVGRGVSYCAVCDASFFRGKKVVVIGGGNSALEEALYLSKVVEEVTIVIRREVFRASASLQAKVLNTPNIHVIKSHKPQEVLHDGKRVTGIKIYHSETGEEQELECSGIFPYIGADPVTKFISDLPILDQNGYIIVDQHFQTSIPGIYGIGDVVVKELRQIVTAANDGAIAAQHIIHQILES